MLKAANLRLHIPHLLQTGKRRMGLDSGSEWWQVSTVLLVGSKLCRTSPIEAAKPCHNIPPRQLDQQRRNGVLG